MTSIHSIKIQVLRFKISTVTVPTKSCDSHSLHRHDQILEKCHDRNAKKNTTKISSINERRQWHRLLWISNIRDVMTHFKLVNRRIKGRRIPIRRTKNMYIEFLLHKKIISHNNSTSYDIRWSIPMAEILSGIFLEGKYGNEWARRRAIRIK